MKKIIIKIENIYWNNKCIYNLWLHGPYGLSRVIEQMPFRFNIKYLRKYGASIGQHCMIERGVVFHRPDTKKPFKNLILEDYSFIGYKCIIDLSEKVTFRKYSGVSGICQVWTHQSSSLVPPRPEQRGEVLFEEGAMVYSGSIITPGLIIGKESQVGANSFINKSIPSKQFWGGVPAKFLKDRLI
jgi:acetyltransferase-like isoleucine patch superfamily enzyme